MAQLPSFFIIGAMKSATSSLYDQLVRQPGIFMCTPKEPNFFSDDKVFKNGMKWYSDLFSGADKDDIIGEASTHYTKMPTYPETVSRIAKYIEKPKLIYVMRHPIDRLVSHYIHEWSQGVISCDINTALDKHPEMISYGLYTMQLKPFIEEFGMSSILPVFFDRIKQAPEAELVRICQFIGYSGIPAWHTDLSPSNVSASRVRRFPLYSLVVESGPATWLRRNLIPKSWRDRVRDNFSMKKRPQLSEQNMARIKAVFDDDLSLLGKWLGTDLNCDNLANQTGKVSLEWQSGRTDC
jgi:hypothetical protein